MVNAHSMHRRWTRCVIGLALVGAIGCPRAPSAIEGAGPVPAAVGRPADHGLVVEDTLLWWRIPDFRPLPWVVWGAPPPGEPLPARTPRFDLQHQVVRVRFDWSRRAVIGSTTLRVAPRPGETLTRVALDAVGMRIGAVRGEGSAALRHRYDGERLIVDLAAPLSAGRRTSFTVDYEVERPRKGLYFIERRRAIWTQGQAEDTRYWVPTDDHPSQRTTWEMIVRVPRGQRVLSNGTLTAERQVGREVEYHWTLERPAPTYLMSIVAGDYLVLQDRWRGIPVSHWTWADSVEATWRGLHRTPEMLELFSARTGLAYPWSKYDQAAVPDYIYGGMENVTASTMADDRILVPRWAVPHVAVEDLVAHELIHQWYGNLITARDWQHAWLHEGFARFFEVVNREAQDAANAALARLTTHEAALAADRRARRPLVYDRVAHDPIELFLTGHVYARGAVVLQMLRREVGDSSFWAGIRAYTARHQLGHVESEDLRRAMEEASGRSLERFFAQWVYGAGYPVFRIRFAHDSVLRRFELVAEQIQLRDGHTGFFTAQVDVELMTERGARTLRVTVRDSITRFSDTLSARPLALRWNAGNGVLLEADFPRSTVMLAHQLGRSQDVTGRIEAVDLLGGRPRERLAREAVARAGAGDSVWAVRARAAAALRRFAPDTGALAALIGVSRDADPRVRLAAAQALGGWDDSAGVARVRVLVESDSSLFVRAAALQSYAELRPDETLRLAPELLARDAWMDLHRTMALEALAAVASQAGWELALPFLAPPRGRRARVAAIAALAASGGERRAELVALLEPLLDDEDLFVRQAAALGLAVPAADPASARARAALERRRAVERHVRVLQAIDAALAAR